MWSNSIWLLCSLTLLYLGNVRMMIEVDIKISWTNPSQIETDKSQMYTTKDSEKITIRKGQRSKEQCQKYSNWLNEKHLKICSHSVEMKIIGGKKTSALEFPHMTQLYYGDSLQPSFVCSASLISEQFLLTAAHCVLGDSGPPLVARLGTGRIESEVIAQVTKCIPYPEYDPYAKHHDIALLQLEKPVEFTNYIHPACLYTDKHIKQKSAIATGWGYTSYRGPISYNLQKVKLPIINYSECRQIYGGVDENNMICAGKDKSGKSTCQGDSGGPLQIEKGCMYHIIGVISVGSKNCSRGTVFARVSYYIPWIESKVWP